MPATKKTTRKQVPFHLRLDASLRRRLKTVAKRAGISMQSIAISGVTSRVEAWENQFDNVDAAAEQAKE